MKVARRVNRNGVASNFMDGLAQYREIADDPRAAIKFTNQTGKLSGFDLRQATTGTPLPHARSGKNSRRRSNRE